MVNTQKKLLLVGVFILLTAFIGAPIATFAAPNARAQQANENREAAQARVADKKVELCADRIERIKSQMTRASEHGTRVIAVFTRISDRTVTFQEERRAEFAEFTTLESSVISSRALAEEKVNQTAAAANDFDCESTERKEMLTAFKQAVQAQNEALKAYKTAVKDLIVGVKSANAQVSEGAEDGTNQENLESENDEDETTEGEL